MAKLGPGARVGDQFNLLRKIGEGGCGEVYLAEQTSLGRHAVVKLMHPELSRDPSYVRRFQREAQLAARLTHHHTAAIYAFGETPDRVLWIAMEYIEGESLHNVLARESAQQVAELLVPVAELLDRAGSMGIIHRDVKPDNIIVAPDGGGRRAVLLDFGLARPMDDNDKLTAVGVAVGSPTYMSPEQVFGPSVDSATDRYALAIILFIAVAKRPPFKHEDRVQLVLMHKRQPVPSLNSLIPTIPLGHPLDQFFTKALAKQPTDRYPSARQMLQEYQQALNYAPLGPEPLPGSGSSPPRAAAPPARPTPAVSASGGAARVTSGGGISARATVAVATISADRPAPAAGTGRTPSAVDLQAPPRTPSSSVEIKRPASRPPATPAATPRTTQVPVGGAARPATTASVARGETPPRGTTDVAQSIREPSGWDPGGAESRRATTGPAMLRSTLLGGGALRPAAAPTRPASAKPAVGAAPAGASRTAPQSTIEGPADGDGAVDPGGLPTMAGTQQVSEYTLPVPAAASEDVQRAPTFLPGHQRLLVRGGGRRIDVLCGAEVMLGKHRDCDVVCRAFPTPEQDAITHGVSRQHARLRVVAGKLLIEDLSSLNGTFVDDKRLTGAAAPLADESQIRLGPVLTLEVRLFRSGAALLRRVDSYHGGFPPTLLLWDRVALGEPVLELVPATGDAVTRWGTLQNPRQGAELFWNGPVSVSWLRAGVAVTPRPQTVQPNDRMVLSGAVVDFEPGVKPGLI